MVRTYIILLIIILVFSSCSYVASPYTMGPAALLGAYEKSGKRKKWLEYAQKGDVYAQYELANSYCCGVMEGAIDNREAYKWFCTAAKNGYAKAQVEMGKIYENRRILEGVNIPQNYVQAYFWYSLAARRVNQDGRKYKKNLESVMNQYELDAAYALLANPRRAECLISHQSPVSSHQ